MWMRSERNETLRPEPWITFSGVGMVRPPNKECKFRFWILRDLLKLLLFLFFTKARVFCSLGRTAPYTQDYFCLAFSSFLKLFPLRPCPIKLKKSC